MLKSLPRDLSDINSAGRNASLSVVSAALLLDRPILTGIQQI
jgi:hypothetical protein